MQAVANGAEAKAAEYKKNAEKALKAWFAGSSKFEAAAECYSNAGVQYKLAKNWAEAGNCFASAAELSLKAKNNTDAANYFTQAAESYKHCDPLKAVDFYNRAVPMKAEANQFSQAAKLTKEIAEIQEESHDLKLAIHAYEQAAEFAKMDSQPTSANQYNLKVAHLKAQDKQFKDAIRIFEQVAQESLPNQLLRYSCKDYYFKAMLCRLASVDEKDDAASLEETLKNYITLCPSLNNTREQIFLTKALKAFSEHDVDGYTAATVELDKIIPIDSWKADIMLQVKEKIKKSGQPDFT